MQDIYDPPELIDEDPEPDYIIGEDSDGEEYIDIKYDMDCNKTHPDSIAFNYMGASSPYQDNDDMDDLQELIDQADVPPKDLHNASAWTRWTATSKRIFLK